MNERSTHHRPPEESQTIQSSAKAADFERGKNRYDVEVALRSQPHPHTLYRWRRLLEQGAETLFPGIEALGRSLPSETGEEEPEVERGPLPADPICLV